MSRDRGIEARKDFYRWFVNNDIGRPKYERPEAVGQIVDMYGQLSKQQNMPGYNDYVQQTKNNAAGNMEALQDSGAGIGNISSIYANELKALSEINMRSDDYISRQRNAYANALRMSAQYSDKEYRENQLNPWLDKLSLYEKESAGRLAEGTNRQQDMFNTAGNIASYAVMNRSMNNQMPDWGESMYSNPGNAVDSAGDYQNYRGYS